MLSCGLGQWARPARPALPRVCMAALSCLSISGARRHTSTQLGHRRQWTCCLVQTQACRQSDARQDPCGSHTVAPAPPQHCQVKQDDRVSKAVLKNRDARVAAIGCCSDAVRTPSFQWKSGFPSSSARLQLLRSAINRLGRETSCSGRP